MYAWLHQVSSHLNRSNSGFLPSCSLVVHNSVYLIAYPVSVNRGTACSHIIIHISGSQLRSIYCSSYSFPKARQNPLSKWINVTQYYCWSTHYIGSVSTLQYAHGMLSILSIDAFAPFVYDSTRSFSSLDNSLSLGSKGVWLAACIPPYPLGTINLMREMTFRSSSSIEMLPYNADYHPPDEVLRISLLLCWSCCVEASGWSFS